jgi:hypothetical protein
LEVDESGCIYGKVLVVKRIFIVPVLTFLFFYKLDGIPEAPRKVPAIMVLSNGAVVKYPKSNRAITLRRALGCRWDNYKNRTFYYRSYGYKVLDELFSK